ncbi:MAG: hypothetical protein L0J31_09645 [Corynebacterium sp.]|nr:hypothetical protein [Corynebacterium sp.]
MSARFIPGKNPLPSVRNAEERGVRIGAEFILGESRQVVPIAPDGGTLERSGRASAEQRGSTTTGAVSYDTPYAAVQHEELHYRHAPGRTAKYLENPLNAKGREAAELIAEEVARGLG